MTTGEKLAALRKRKGITQDHLAEILKVSRQSVSRWELNAAFPETEIGRASCRERVLLIV